MTKLLEKGIEAIRALPSDRQDMAGELLLSIATRQPRYQLTPEQMEDVKLAIAEADRGALSPMRTSPLAGKNLAYEAALYAAR